MSEKKSRSSWEEQVIHYATLLVSINDKLRLAKVADDQAEVKKQGTAKHLGYLELEKAVKRRQPP